MYTWLEKEKETTFEILPIMNKAKLVLVKVEYFKKNYPLHDVSPYSKTHNDHTEASRKYQEKAL